MYDVTRAELTEILRPGAGASIEEFRNIRRQVSGIEPPVIVQVKSRIGRIRQKAGKIQECTGHEYRAQIARSIVQVA